MELGGIRSQFIQTHLRRVLQTPNHTLWNYFEWFAGSIQEAGREVISYQRRLLEDSCQRTQEQAFTESIPH